MDDNPNSPPPKQAEIFDCLILSGGGSKGAYGAGAAKALAEYRTLRRLTRPICYIGTSAGALNAAVLATKGADALIAFWLALTPSAVLGVWIKDRKVRGLLSRLRRLLRPNEPFYLYPNTSLRSLLNARLKFEDLAGAHVIIPVTNYSAARLEGFYASGILDTCKAYDDRLGRIKDRRLLHLTRIEDQTTLIDALLASSAYPIFFPPVPIGGSLYIDGGVGNNTPTREAAYFYRFIEELKLAKCGDVYCIKQDPPRTLEQGPEALTLSRLLQRTLDVYHQVHTEPIIRAWYRINTEAEHLEERIQAFDQWLAEQPIENPIRQQISDRVRTQVARLGGATLRRQIPMLEVEPSAPLGDTFDFAPQKVQSHITTGYLDMLKTLREQRRIDDAEYRDLSNRPLWRTDVAVSTEPQANHAMRPETGSQHPIANTDPPSTPRA